MNGSGNRASRRSPMSHFLQTLGVVADIAAIAALVTGSAKVLVLGLGLGAVVVGAVLILRRWHQVLDAAVLLGAVIVIAGAGTFGYALANVDRSTPQQDRQASPTAQSEPPTTTQTTISSSSQPTSSDAPTSTTSTAEPSAPEYRYLGEMDALNTNAVQSPVPVTIGTRTFPNSFEMGCSKSGTSATWPLAEYSQLLATVGLDKNEGTAAAVNGYESVIQVFAGDRQLGKDYLVSINKTQELSVPLDSAVQVTIKCRIVDPRSGSGSYYQVAFGDARAVKTL